MKRERTDDCLSFLAPLARSELTGYTHTYSGRKERRGGRERRGEKEKGADDTANFVPRKNTLFLQTLALRFFQARPWRRLSRRHSSRCPCHAVPPPCLHRPMSHLRPSMSTGGSSSSESTAPDRPGSAPSPSSDPRLPRSSAPLTPTNSGKSTIRSPGVYSDRFIPSRRGVNLQDSFALLPDSPPKKRDAPQEGGKDDNLDTYTMLLRSELLGDDPQGARRPDEHAPPQSPQRNLFRYRTQPAPRDENAAFALSPVGSESQRVLCSPRKVPRKISTVPYKVLDAPALQARRPPASAHVGAHARRRGPRPERHHASFRL